MRPRRTAIGLSLRPKRNSKAGPKQRLTKQPARNQGELAAHRRLTAVWRLRTDKGAEDGNTSTDQCGSVHLRLVHNPPSRGLTPSHADIGMTKGSPTWRSHSGIAVHDHIIAGKD